mmetsp:Transcript_10803/g.14019  ORF Transcript_10803/g.14019 Transcript_10803/m.14019 type:complete len:256 (-) Transcript_10803:189-956(-)
MFILVANRAGNGNKNCYCNCLVREQSTKMLCGYSSNSQGCLALIELTRCPSMQIKNDLGEYRKIKMNTLCQCCGMEIKVEHNSRTDETWMKKLCSSRQFLKKLTRNCNKIESSPAQKKRDICETFRSIMKSLLIAGVPLQVSPTRNRKEFTNAFLHLDESMDALFYVGVDSTFTLDAVSFECASRARFRLCSMKVQDLSRSKQSEYLLKIECSESSTSLYLRSFSVCQHNVLNFGLRKLRKLRTYSSPHCRKYFF